MKKAHLNDRKFLLWLLKNKIKHNKKDEKLMNALYSEYYLEHKK